MFLTSLFSSNLTRHPQTRYRRERSLPSGIANQYYFTTRRLDDESQLYLYRNRYYHSGLGRFVSRDPLEYEGSEWNLYEYVNGMPTVAVDPNGLGCKVKIACTRQGDILSRDRLTRTCYYACRYVSVELTGGNTGGVSGRALDDCSPFLAEIRKGSVWPDIREFRGVVLLSRFGITVCIPPGPCEQPLRYELNFTSNNPGGMGNCSRDACRMNCGKANQASQFCSLAFKDKVVASICKTAISVGQSVCHDFCNLWCREGGL